MKAILVFESQAVLHAAPSEIERMLRKLDQFDKGWDLFFLDVDYHNPKNGEIIAPNLGDERRNKRHIDKDIAQIYSRYGTTAFVISERGMKKITRHLTSQWIDLPYDQALFTVPNLRIYGTRRDIITNKYKAKIERPADHVQDELHKTIPSYQLGSTGTFDPIDLLTPARFDVMAKYIYASYELAERETNWHVDLYKSHIGKWNNFYEGEPLKVGYDAFKEAFHALLKSMRKNGYLKEYAPLPINTVGSLINGSHRLGTALALNTPVRATVKQKGKKLSPFFAQLKNSHHLEIPYLDHMTYEYAKLKPNTYVTCLFPSAGQHVKVAQTIINQYANIVAWKDIWLTEGGQLELIRLIYPGEGWVGTPANNFRQGRVKQTLCFPKEKTNRYPLRVYLIECESHEKTIEMKRAFRELCQIGNDSMHVNDTHEQTVMIAASLFNQNSIAFMNRRKRCALPNFDTYFAQLRDYIEEYELDRESLCVDTSGVLSAFGLRDCSDIDLLHKGDLPVTSAPIDSHNGYLKYHAHGLDEILYNPTHHFYYMGIKFASLDLIRSMKQKRNEQKDRNDIALIDAL
jgi:hypothetical protein